MNYPKMMKQTTGSSFYRPRSSQGYLRNYQKNRSQTPRQTSGRSLNQTKKNQQDKNIMKKQRSQFVKMRQVQKHISGVKDPLVLDLNRNHHAKTHKQSVSESEEFLQKRRSQSKGNIFGSHLKFIDQELRPSSEHHEATLGSSSQGYYQSDSMINGRSQVTQCFDQDTSIIDNLKLNDPVILKLLGDLKIDSNMNHQDMENVINQNSDYLLHMLSCCACFKCDCGFCKCSYINCSRINNKQSRFLTTYNRNFILSDCESYIANQIPTINQNHYETLSKIGKQNFQGTMISIQKSSYVPKTLQKKDPSQESVKNNFEFAASTTYQKNFIDWKYYDPRYQFRRPLHRSVHKEVKLSQSTIYNTEFNIKQMNPDISAIDVKQNQVNRPFIISYPNVNLSMYQDQFRKDQRDVNLKPQNKYQSETEKYDPTNSFNNQYLSVSKQSFQEPKINLCNSKISKKNQKEKQLLKNKLFSRIREITMLQKSQQ